MKLAERPVMMGVLRGCLIAVPLSSMIGRMKKDVEARLQAVLVGLGYARDGVLADIEPFRMYITSQIDPAMTVEDYLAQVWPLAW